MKHWKKNVWDQLESLKKWKSKGLEFKKNGRDIKVPTKERAGSEQANIHYDEPICNRDNERTQQRGARKGLPAPEQQEIETC